MTVRIGPEVAFKAGAIVLPTVSTGGPYYVGQVVKLLAKFTNSFEIPADPTKVTFQVIDGEGNEEVISGATKLEIGVYQTTIYLTCSGTWRYRGVGTGTIVAAKWKTFSVLPEAFQQ